MRIRQRHALGVAILAGSTIVVATALAKPKMWPTRDRIWRAALAAARPNLDACSATATTAHVYGDVDVRISGTTGAWTLSPSRSLGASGASLVACVRRAIDDHLDKAQLADADGGDSTHTAILGTPLDVLPPFATMLPLWRKAVATKAPADRAAFEHALPADYHATADLCIATDRAGLRAVEDRWRATAGDPVPLVWSTAIASLDGYAARWLGTDVLTTGARGQCLVPVTAADRATLQTKFDAQGTCWVGGFDDMLLRPRFAFPATKHYTQVATSYGAACALGTDGIAQCCGPIAAPLRTPPPLKFASIVMGASFACGLDATGLATCWGSITNAPAKPFTKISAGDHEVCGVTKQRMIECWGGSSIAPYGPFTDVAVGRSTCGLRPNGVVECWDGGTSIEQHPPGTYAAIAADHAHACGLRRDGTIACWQYAGDPIVTRVPDRFVDLAIGDIFTQCGRRADDTVACASDRLPPAGLPVPTGTFAQIAGGHDQFCGIRRDGQIECWGDVWLGARGDGARRDPQSSFATTDRLAGRVVDEHGAPIANAEIVIAKSEDITRSLAFRARSSTQSLADLLAALPPDRATYAIATTDRDGRWTATLVLPKPWNADLFQLVTAPKREIIERTAKSWNPIGFEQDVVLRPGSTLDLAVACAKCDHPTPPATITTRLERQVFVGGTHLEHVAPGIYRVNVDVQIAKGAETGSVVIEVPFAATALKAPVTTK